MQNALDKIKLNKSPGTDLFTVEFYRYFWLELNEFVFKSVKDAFERECLSN